MDRSMNHRWVCGIWGVWFPAMMLCLGTLLAVSASADGEQNASAESRVWTDSTGRFTVEAELVGVAGDQVTLKRFADGQQVTLRIEQLSTADQQYLQANERGKVDDPVPAGNAPPLAVAPFDAAAAKEHQEAWAKHLGQPVKVTNSIGMKLVLIPPGEFVMGCPESESDREGNETQHPVRITKPYYLGMYEVTRAQWERVMGMNPSASSFPVDRVFWKDAVEFCRKLSAMPAEQSAGRVYRLPTEAEWEYACRAGSTTVYSFGDSAALLGQYAWYSDNSIGRTHPVGRKKPNAWGLYDMHGNVAEWCSDWYDGSYYANSPVNDPTGPPAGSDRVHRGGSWGNPARSCRSAYRYWYWPGNRFSSCGFRVAFSSGNRLRWEGGQ